MRRIWIVVGLLALPGCEGASSDDADAVVITLPDAAPDMAPALDMAPPPDMAPAPDLAPPPDMAPPATDVCDALDLPRRPFETDGVGVAFGDRAGDFTLALLDGETFTLSARWTGCDSYVFLNYFNDLRAIPGGSPWPDDALFETSLSGLVADGPRNVHYLFTSYAPEAEDRVARMTALRDAVTGVLADLDDADAAFWRARFHFVTERSADMSGGVGDFFAAQMAAVYDADQRVDLGDRGVFGVPLPNAFGIDREQRWDPAGSLDPFVGAASELSMAAWLGHFYDHKAALADRIAAEADATVVPLLDDTVTDRIFVRTVTLPPADEMAAFDRLDLDIAVRCPHRNPFACSEWDRIARVEWCADPECAERAEIVRWITPYWRRGERRWLIDASPFLPWMTAGGEQTFRIEMGPGWERATEREARISLRLRTTGGPMPLGAERAFTGGPFNAEYNMREPFVFTPPPEAEAVELVLILSGHGQTDDYNCAEWCDHRHAFTLNDAPLDTVRSGPGIGQLDTCARRARDGVPPGQWGNWAPGRAYWCPGLPVDLIRIDITDDVMPGVENTLSYEGQFRGGAPLGGDIALSAYVIWSR